MSLLFIKWITIIEIKQASMKRVKKNSKDESEIISALYVYLSPIMAIQLQGTNQYKLLA